MKYKSLGRAEEGDIISYVFNPQADQIEINRLLFIAAYTHSEEFFIHLAHRVFDELGPDTQYTLIDAIDSYMQSRDTLHGVKELMPKIIKFVERFSEDEYPEKNYIIEGIKFHLDRLTSGD